jgi:acetoacetate decarboxylase
MCPLPPAQRIIADLTLPYGRVLHNYLQEG